MNTPNNARSQQTKQTIIDEFLKLAELKSVFKITVREICEKSNVNRSTFYAYYEDIYDLIVKIEKEMAQKRQECMYNYAEEHFEFVAEVILRHIRENQRYYRLFYKNGNQIQIEKISKIENLQPEHKIVNDRALKLASKYKNLFTFYMAGINGLIRQWLENGCSEDEEEILEIMNKQYANLQKELEEREA